MRAVHYINFLRILTFCSSVCALSCHAIQCTLSRSYEQKTGIPDWIHSGHWQYLVWYGSLTFSVLCAAAVCIHAGCCQRAHVVRGDRTLGVLNILCLGVTIAVITLFGGQEPWTNGLVEFSQPAKGFIPYCGQLDANNDQQYPLLYYRCILIDSTFVCAALAWLSWTILFFSAIAIKPTRPVTVTRLPNETKQMQFIPGSYPTQPWAAQTMTRVPTPAITRETVNDYEPDHIRFPTHTPNPKPRRISNCYT